MSGVCKNEQDLDNVTNRMNYVCYGPHLLTPLYAFPYNFAKCGKLKYDVFKCRQMLKK